ncbi:MAG TPA: enoyl-CoA hydratase-related protein [Bacteroidota bacterium]|nr:enoyl-CoA hydratase-related protein [Bacteroidota bacterium]
MSTYEHIELSTDNSTATLVLNRPPLNVMNIAMMREINAGLEILRTSPGAKVLVIKAEGKAFSAGVDIADHTSDKVEGMMKEFHRTFELLHNFKIPSIAIVDGAALGGGCELAIYCDMVIASERAKFGQPEIKVGVFPPIAAAMFPRLIGRNRSLELLMSGETISAAEAERIGLINRVFPVEGFTQHVDTFLSKFTAQSKVILELTKRAVDTGLYRPCMEAITRAEDLYMNEMMKTEDAVEGLKAFLEKRTPMWKNR